MQRNRFQIRSLCAASVAGFTLIEALISVMIFSFSCIAGLTLMGFSQLQNMLEQERARAHQVVTQEMERVRHQLYTRITGGNTVTIWDNGTPDVTTDDTVGTLEVIMRDPDGTEIFAAPVPSVRVQVEVTLSWNPRGRLGDTKTFRETVMTYITP